MNDVEGSNYDGRVGRVGGIVSDKKYLSDHQDDSGCCTGSSESLQSDMRRQQSQQKNDHSASNSIGCISSETDSFKRMTISDDKQHKAQVTATVECSATRNLNNAQSSTASCNPAAAAAASLVSNEQRRTQIMHLRERCYTKTADGDNYLHRIVVDEVLEDIPKVIHLADDVRRIDEVNNNYQTAIMLAVLVRNPIIIRMLICAGANAHRVDRRGNTPLHMACEFRDPILIEALLKEPNAEEIKKFYPSLPYPWPKRQPLKSACEVTNYKGLTPVHTSSLADDKEGLKLLLKYGADINVPDQCSLKTALHYAVEHLKYEMVAFLVEECHADVNALTGVEQTPLDVAYQCSSEGMVNYLQRNGGRRHNLHEYHSDTSLSEDEDDDDDDDCMELSDDETYDDIRFQSSHSLPLST